MVPISRPASSVEAPTFSAADRTRAELDRITSLVDDEMRAVNHRIEARLTSEIALIRQVSGHIIHSGGKRMRPLAVLLSAGTFGYTGDAHILLAAVVEFIHTATLLHDDVVDGSELRRGQATANELWGNQASVLVGDFLYSRSFEMMVDVRNPRVMEVMARATNRIAEGEVMQLLNCHSPDVDEKQYLETIRRKTATLFEAATQLGAVITAQDPATEKAMARYGLHLGTAFQLVDDVLDYSSNAEDIGKNIGDDLAEGKPTLPLIQAIAVADPQQREFLCKVVTDGGSDRVDEVAAAIESTGALAYTSRRAAEQVELARNALSGIPESPYREALLDLADFVVDRWY